MAEGRRINMPNSDLIVLYFKFGWFNLALNHVFRLTEESEIVAALITKSDGISG